MLPLITSFYSTCNKKNFWLWYRWYGGTGLGVVEWVWGTWSREWGSFIGRYVSHVLFSPVLAAPVLVTGVACTWAVGICLSWIWSTHLPLHSHWLYSNSLLPIKPAGRQAYLAYMQDIANRFFFWGGGCTISKTTPAATNSNTILYRSWKSNIKFYMGKKQES